MAHIEKTAIVLGGSIGGTLVARVLANHFERVIVLERDPVTTASGAPRKGAPQGRHAHGLLYRGREVFEELFPGFTDAVLARGGASDNPGLSGRWIHHGVMMARVPARSNGVLGSRPLIEETLRALLLAQHGTRVELRNEVDVLELVTADDGRVRGVKLRSRSNGTESTLAADLVVDALGRGSPMLRWLAALGYEAPPVEEVKVDVHYTTRSFVRRPNDLAGDAFVVTAPLPPNRGAGVVLAQENDRFIVTLMGYLGQRAPEDLEGFRAYARTLAAPDIGEFVAHAEPCDEPCVASFPASRRRRYEKLRRFPDGLLVFGDAIASFNPIYGQGMTVAAEEALALDRCLDRGAKDLARRFFSDVAKIVDVPWGSAVLNDLRFPEVKGPRSIVTSFLHRYLDRVYARGASDPVVSRVVLDVVNLVVPPPAVFAPSVLRRVVFGGSRPTPRALMDYSRPVSE